MVTGSNEKRLAKEPLDVYLITVQALGEKLGRIATGKKEIASSLGRAAAALRSIAAASRPK